MMEEVHGLLAENDRLLQERKIIEAGEHTQLGLQYMSAEFDRRGRRVTELLECHRRLNNTLFDEHLRFTALCTQAAMDLGELVTPAIASARDELGLPFDADAYARVTREARLTATASVEAFMKDLRQLATDMDLSGTAHENSISAPPTGPAGPAAGP
jgi:hypothetical protein